MKIKRLDVVKAMGILALAINDEDIFAEWLISGIADGDLECESELEYYCDKDVFAELMQTFLDVMSAARESGGLYITGVKSDSKGVL